MVKKDVRLSPMENFLLSGSAAVISKTISAPIERVKLMIQNQDEMIKAGALDRPYKGPIDCFRRVISTEGVPHLWRGNVANCLRYFPTQALNFMFKDQIKAQFRASARDSQASAFGKNVASGGLAGALSLTFVYSLDYCRTRLAADVKGVTKAGGQRQFSGMLDVYKKTLASDGVAGLYRGFMISCVGIVVYRGIYFGLYDTIMPTFGSSQNLALSFAVGYAVTVSAGLCSYPIDTIRRRMMMTSGTALKYRHSLDCAQQIVRGEGVRSLFKGNATNILRGMAGAGTLAGFDKFKSMYVESRYGQSD